MVRGSSHCADAMLSCKRRPVCLKYVYLRHVTDASMSLLRMFCSVTTIQLEAETDDTGLNLDPLQRLPHLTSLETVDGRFYMLDCLKHLTTLIATESELNCAELC